MEHDHDPALERCRVCGAMTRLVILNCDSVCPGRRLDEPADARLAEALRTAPPAASAFDIIDRTFLARPATQPRGAGSPRG